MHQLKKQIQIGLLAALSFSALATAAPAQDTPDPDQLKSQEDWLRYSNWEHRATFKKPVPRTENSNSADDKKLHLPEHPGSQTVEGGQFSIPGWAFQSQQQTQRPAEIIIGAESFGSTHNASPPYFGGYSYPPFFGGSPWRYYGASGWGHAWNGAWNGGWNHGWNGAWNHGWNGGWNHGWNGGWKHGWNGLGFGAGWGGLLSPGYGAPLAGLGSGFNRSRLGPTVIQTGPSPASGNYYQPSTGDSSASGNYYASGTPWQVPINGPNNPKEYWGPEGSPFK